MADETKNLDSEINKVSSLLTTATKDIAEIREALEYLKTSSNATFGGTIVFNAIRRFEAAIEKIEARTVHYEHQILRILRQIEQGLQPRFIILITQESTNMAIGVLVSPGTAALLLALLDNGAPYVAPAGSTYTFAPSLTSSDSSVTIAADPSVPFQFDVTIPAGDPGTSVTFNASATAPDGTTATGTLTIPLAPEPQQFTISVTQTA